MPARRSTAKKTYNLPPELIERAKRVLKVRTETEAIIRSLEEVLFTAEVERSVRTAGGALPSFARSK
jgi:hypothetical protein